MSPSYQAASDRGDLVDVDARELFVQARRMPDRRRGRVVSYSPKVFIPLTRLCRDRCGYCVYRREPGAQPPFMEIEEVLELARRGARMGCREALFVLGERPEEAYPQAAEWLRRRGYASSIDYLEAACRAVLEQTPLLPHSNAGTLSVPDMKRLAQVNVSLGLMLESTSRRLMQPGGPHAQAPSKDPERRLQQLEQAGRLGIPFTTGILIGIGETIEDRIESLRAIRRLSGRYGHIQETIVQNFRRKAGTPMARSPEPSHREMLRTIALARLILGPQANVQAPPNLARAEGRYGLSSDIVSGSKPGGGPAQETRGGPALPTRVRDGTATQASDPGKPYLDYLQAGINDYGGLSPLTFDWVNPEAPWPHLRELWADVAGAGYRLRPRLAAYPEYLQERWLPAPLLTAARRFVDEDGFCPEDPDRAPLPTSQTHLQLWEDRSAPGKGVREQGRGPGPRIGLDPAKREAP